MVISAKVMRADFAPGSLDGINYSLGDPAKKSSDRSPHEAAQPENARFVDRRQRVHCSPCTKNKTALQKQQGSE
jgi:hypothetical protein